MGGIVLPNGSLIEVASRVRILSIIWSKIEALAWSMKAEWMKQPGIATRSLYTKGRVTVVA